MHAANRLYNQDESLRNDVQLVILHPHLSSCIFLSHPEIERWRSSTHACWQL